MKLPTIPAGFAERFLWHPDCPPIPVQSPGESLPSDQFTPTFPAALSQELRSVISFAFSEASGAQEAPDQSYAVPQTVTLTCPMGGNLLIDSAVRMVAAEHHADVLVLDSLEFAAGGLGAMGDAANVIDLMYKVKGDESSSEEDDDMSFCEEDEESASEEGDGTSPCEGDENIRQFFDALVTLGGEQPSCHASCTVELAERPKRRIIYLRDFSVINRVSMPLMINLLRALENSQTGDIPECPPVTIIVFGIAKFDDLTDPKAVPQTYTLYLNNGCPTLLKSKVSQRRFDSLLSHLLLPQLTGPSPPQVPVDKIWQRRVHVLASRTVAISIFGNNGDLQECMQLEQSEKVARNHDINNLMLRLCLGGKCGDLVGDLAKDIMFRSDSVELETNAGINMATKRVMTEASPVLTISEADNIAGVAIGLASPRSMPVDSRHIAEASNILKNRRQERASWETARQEKTMESRKADAGDEDPVVKRVRQDSLSPVERELLECIVNSRELGTAFTDICIDYSVIESLQKVASLPLLHPSYFKSGVLAKEAMGGALLYGPPGTGKTMICRYLAHSCQARMISIRPSDVTSKCVGDSEKRIAAVFSLAARLAPCIIFIDEADALFTSRKDRTYTWERNMLTEFLQAMDGLTSAAKNKDKGVIVIGATNRPFDLDAAILRRLPCKILVDAPDAAARAKLLKHYLKGNKLHAHVNLEEIAQRTNYYSASDIKNLCVAAALASVKDTVGDKWGVPANPTAEEGLPAPLITLEHVRRALSEIFPSLSVGNYQELRSWGAGCHGY